MRSYRFALAALALPLLAGCKDLVSNQTIAAPAGGAMFSNYVALGTSISAGVQSGGINDSTQKQAFPYQLATAMGLTPGVNWFYPSFPFPGCTPPFSNILTKTYVGGTASTCTFLNPAYARPYENNLGVPSMRVGQALHISQLLVPATDILQAAMFVTGGRSPVDILDEARPTFVTMELGANDALHAATSGDTAVLTPLALFTAQYDTLATRVAATGAKVAVANVPNVDNVPYLTKGQVFFCLNTGACPGIAATAPFNSPLFTVSSTCAPAASGIPGAVGDSMGVSLPATGAIVQTLVAGAAGGGATLTCGGATPTATIGAAATPVGPLLSSASFRTVATRVIAFNAAIAAEVSSHGWALVNVDSALTVLVAAGQVPPIPNLASPSSLFGTYFSLDGFHPSSAGSKLIADLFVAAINKKYGTTLTAP